MRIQISLVLLSLCLSSPSRTRAGEIRERRVEQTRQPALFFSCAFSPDGRIFAGGTGAGAVGAKGEGGDIILWDAATGRIKRTLVPHVGSINRVVFSKDSKVLAGSSSETGVITICDAVSGVLISKISVDEHSVVDVDGKPALFLSTDGSQMVAIVASTPPVGERVELVRKRAIAIGWNTRTGAQIWRADLDNFRDAAMSPDGSMVVAASVKVIKPNASPNDVLVIGDFDQRFNFLNARTGEVIRTQRIMDNAEFLQQRIISFLGTTKIASVDLFQMTVRDVETGQIEYAIEFEGSRFSDDIVVDHGARTFARHGQFAAPEDEGKYFIECRNVADGKITSLTIFEAQKMLLGATISTDFRRLGHISGPGPIIIDLPNATPLR